MLVTNRLETPLIKCAGMAGPRRYAANPDPDFRYASRGGANTSSTFAPYRHRVQRLSCVVRGPYSGGASHHRRSMRLVKVRRGIASLKRFLIRFTPTHHTAVIDARLSVTLRDLQLISRHLRVRQPKEIGHFHSSMFGP